MAEGRGGRPILQTDDPEGTRVPTLSDSPTPRPARRSTTGRAAPRRSALTLVLLAGVLAGGVVAPMGGCDRGKSDAQTVSVNLADAQVRTFEITTLASGELEAKDRVELRSNVERQTSIVEIVPEGSRVQAGDILVELNSDEIKREIEEEELQVAEARLNLEAAETAYDIQLSDNAASLQKAQLAVDLAQLALEQWKNGDNVKAIQQREVAIEKTQRDLNRLKDKYVRSKELHANNFLSDDELLLDEIRLLEAQAAYETAKLDLETYTNYQLKRDEEQKKSDLKEARQELVRVEKTNEINLKNRDSTRQNRAVQLGRREERLAEWRAQLEACTLRAPTAGLVVYGSTVQSDDWRSQNEGPIAVGRQIRNNDLIIALPDTSEMVAAVKVHESLAGRVRPGQPANIKVEALGDLTIPGTVQSVGLLAESGGWRDPNRREYTVKITVQPGPHSDDLKPSMRCQAEIVLGTVADSLSVPVQSVFSDGAVRYVLVPEGARFDRRPVALGRRSDLYAEITAGLEAGEQVLIREPRAGEVIEDAWQQSELAVAGYALDEEGNPRPVGGRGGWGGGRPGGAPGAGGGGGEQTKAAPAAPAGDEAPKAAGETASEQPAIAAGDAETGDAPQAGEPTDEAVTADAATTAASEGAADPASTAATPEPATESKN